MRGQRSWRSMFRGGSYAAVHICRCVKRHRPRKDLWRKHVHSLSALPTHSIRTHISHLLKVRVHSYSSSFSRTRSETFCLQCTFLRKGSLFIFVYGYPYTRAGSYLGSQGTYPREMPLTSLTTISKLSKSKTVQASKATSRRTRVHSKKA
jgi:hypothetical protein